MHKFITVVYIASKKYTSLKITLVTKSKRKFKMQYYFIAHKKGVGDRAKEVPGLFTGNITRIVIKKRKKIRGLLRLSPYNKGRNWPTSWGAI